MASNIKPENFKITCNGCHARLTVPMSKEGKKLQCPKCRKVIACAAATTTPNPSEADIPSGAKIDPAHAPTEPAPRPEDRDSLTPTRKPATDKPTASPRPDDDPARFSPFLKWGAAGIAAILLVLGSYQLYAAFFDGPAVGNLRGNVYLGDTLLHAGDVQFFPKSGNSIKGVIHPDGTYEAKGIERGELIITVMQLNPKYKDGATRRKEAKGKLENLFDDGERQHLLPQIYADTLTSPLRFTLEKRNDTYDIHLSKE